MTATEFIPYGILVCSECGSERVQQKEYGLTPTIIKVLLTSFHLMLKTAGVKIAKDTTNLYRKKLKLYLLNETTCQGNIRKIALIYRYENRIINIKTRNA